MHSNRSWEIGRVDPVVDRGGIRRYFTLLTPLVSKPPTSMLSIGRFISHSRLTRSHKLRCLAAIGVPPVQPVPSTHVRQTRQFSGVVKRPEQHFGGEVGARFDSELEAFAAGQAALEFNGLSRFTADHFEISNAVLDYFRNRPSITAGQVALCLDLLERLVAECAKSGQIKYTKTIQTERCYIPILKHWKKISKEYPETVASPKAITQRLYKMTETLPAFKLTSTAIAIILEALVVRSTDAEAPFLASKLVDFLNVEAKKDQALAPDLYIYSILIHSWAESGLPIAGEKIEETLKQMLSQQISPSPVTYNIMLKYWSSIGDVRKCDALLRRMELHGVKQTVMTWKHMVEGYLLSGQHHVEAEQLLKKMIDKVAASGEDVDQLIPAINCFNRSHKQMMRFDSLKKYSSVKASERILALCDENREAFNENFRDKTYLGFMDVMAVHGMSRKAEHLFRRVEQPTEAAYAALILAYCKSHQPEQAIKVGKELLSDHRVPLTGTFALNGVVRACADSKHTNAFSDAKEFIHLMDTDCRCREHGIKPDTFTYKSLLKCLGKTTSAEDAGAKAQEVLHEMRLRKLTVDATVMTMAIKVCMNSRDYSRADAIMQEMEKSSTPPNTSTYHAIMQHWATIGSKAAAERTERILMHLKRLSMASPSLRPTPASYGLAINAWMRSKSPEASQRIWELYEASVKSGCTQDWATYSALVSFYCTADDAVDVKRADELILAMEHDEVKTVPTHLHYNLVTSAWFKQDDVQSATSLALRRVGNFGKKRNDSRRAICNYIHGVVQTAIKKGDTLKATILVAKIEELHNSTLLDLRPKLSTLMLLTNAWEASSADTKKQHLARLAHQVSTYSRKANLSSLNHGRMAA